MDLIITTILIIAYGLTQYYVLISIFGIKDIRDLKTPADNAIKHICNKLQKL